MLFSLPKTYLVVSVTAFLKTTLLRLSQSTREEKVYVLLTSATVLSLCLRCCPEPAPKPAAA